MVTLSSDSVIGFITTTLSNRNQYNLEGKNPVSAQLFDILEDSDCTIPNLKFPRGEVKMTKGENSARKRS